MSEHVDRLRAGIEALPDAPPVLHAYLEKVRTAAYKVTDDDVAELKAAGVAEDVIFEQTVAVAVREGLRRLADAERVLG